MANDELVKLQVSDDLIRGIVSKQVSAAVVTAMGGREELLEKVVTAVLTMKVDSEGKISSYSSSNGFQWLDVLFRQMIQEAAKQAVKAWIDANKDMIQKAVVKGFQKQSNQMSVAFVDGLMKSIESDWKFKVDVNFTQRDR